MRNRFIPAIGPGESVDSSLYNGTADALRDIQKYVAAHSAERRPGSSRAASTDVFLATIQTAGPNGEADYTEANYWCKRAAPNPQPDGSAATYSSDGVGTDVIEPIDDPSNNSAVRPFWLTATNLAEFTSDSESAPGDGTHTIAPGTMVLVVGLVDPGNPSRKWYAFCCPPPGIFPVLLSNSSGSAGSDNPVAQATLTYTVKTLNGTQIGTNVAVWKSRQYGHVAAATRGSAFTDQGGTLWIYDCDEVIDASNCT